MSYFERAGEILKDAFTPELPTREGVVGRAEVLGTLASSVPAFLAGIGSLGANLRATRDPQQALDAYRDTMESLTYMPRTPGGIERLSQFGELIEPIGRAYEAYGTAVGEGTGSPLAGEYAEEFLDPLMAIPPLAAASKITRKAPTVKSNIVADVDEFGLYSKAQNLALQLPQAKQSGSDVLRYFLKQGVKREELEDLGLIELFKEPRVTQAQILDRIDQRKVGFEEEISYGGSARETDIDIQELSFEEAFGDGVNDEVMYQRDEYIRDVDFFDAEMSRRDSSANDPTELLRWQNNEIEYDDLSITAQNNLDDIARQIAEENYNQEPYRQATLTIDGEPTDYRLIDTSFTEGFIPRADAPFFLRRHFGMEPNQQLRSVSEQELGVELQGLALATGDLDLGTGDVQWERYTLPGGENYREFRFRIPGTTLFSEDTHFRGEPNNIFHARTKDRIGDDGSKILYVEELQSDWAQTGREKGFQDPVALQREVQKGSDVVNRILPALEGFMPELSDFRDGSSPDLPRPLGGLESFQMRFGGEGGPYSAQDLRLGIAGLEKFLERDENLRRDLAFLKAEDEVFDKLPRERKIYFATKQMSRQNLAARMQREGVPQETIDQFVLQTPRAFRNEVEGLTDQQLDYIALKGFKAYLQERPRAFNPFLKKANAELNARYEQFGVPGNISDLVLEQLETLNPDYVRKLGEQIDQPQLGPFVGNTDSWNKLAIKRLAQVAQEEGYDKISFSPGSVQYARWPQRYDSKTEQYVDNVGIKVQYDVNVPKAVKKALGVEAKTENVPIFYRRTDQLNDELDELERTGEVQRNGIIVNVPSPTVDLNEITVTGETVKDKVKAGQSMYAVPIAITAGGLAAIGDPEVAEAEEAEGTGISALPTRSL
jgi:hypothetical protein|tara:strand:- start:1028 stop:3691 length:2664 start_codon:yes stop_codon:yes gene_type:complete